MAIPNKPSSATRLFSRPAIFNNPPPIPTEYTKSGLAQYKSDHDIWWQQHKAVLDDAMSRLSTVEARINDLSPEPTAVSAIPVTVKI